MPPISTVSFEAAGARTPIPSKHRRSLRCAPPPNSTDFSAAPRMGTLLEQGSRDLLVVTVQLIEAACRAREGDSHGTRAHIARAVALLDGHSGPRIGKRNSERSSSLNPRGAFATWQSRRLAAHLDANLAGKIVIKELAASFDLSVGP